MAPPSTPAPSAVVPASDAASPSRRFGWGLAVIVVVFAVVRLAGMFGDLWLDEIWSVRMIEPLKSPVEIITAVQHDNNHPLNSLWLYALRPVKGEWALRSFSWIMGAAAVALAGLIGRRQFNRWQATASPGQADVAGWVTATVFGGSYFMIHYASEARGYAAAVAFALLALLALLHAAEPKWWRWAVVYALACLLGLLAHLAVLQVMIAGVVWTALESGGATGNWRDRVGRLLAWHAVPWAGAGFYYFGFVRHLKIGGGPENPLATVLGEAAAYTTGWPAQVGGAVALPLLLLVVVTVLVLLARRDWRLAVFYGLAVLVTPAIGPALSRFGLLFPRYFIVSAALALVLVGAGLARLWARGGAWREVVLGVLVLFLAGNGVHVARLAREGRGQYQAAVRHLAARTPTAIITAAGDHDFRNFAVLDYYQAAAGAERPVRYYPGDRIPARGVEWLFVHRLDGEAPPADAITDVRGNRYRLDAVFRHAALSGWDWYLYRNERLPAR